ncbi:hypothetical protein P9274_20015 [Schinkia azotoformans]|uniref:hypothetical protein n=1 Tax=Schinkia azotoformans TaxID=1454 RepID=UPI002E1A9587|nr:hypothetical protein [Schinkia azotoformans]
MDNFRITQPLDEQSRDTFRVAQEFFLESDFNFEDADLFISKAHEEALEAYAAMLEEQEKRLVNELKQTVMRLSSKIRIIRMLKRRLYQEVGMQMGLATALEAERRDTQGEKTTANSNRKGNHEKIDRLKQDTSVAL